MPLNNQPIIGILSQSPSFREKDCKSYIAQSYVKYFQIFGARIIPIIMGEDQYEIIRKLSIVNGVVFPGGHHKHSDFGDTGSFVFE